MGTDNLFALICGAVITIMLIYYVRHKRRIRAFLFGSLTGLAALLILNKFGGQFDTCLPLNIFNVCGSAVLGVPFVICLVILNIIC